MRDNNQNQAIQFLTKLTQTMVQRKGSDLFLTAGYPPAVKIDGKMTKIADQDLDEDNVKLLARSVMSDKQIMEFEATKECNFAVEVAGAGRFRVNVFTQQGMMGLVMRSIAAKIPSLDDLKLPPIMKDLALTKRGLIIFVGGTGTGKTTSLAALLDHRNANSYGHIITLEDPIEFVHPHKNCLVTQREIGVDSESWESALKNALRQAPDVILMGEIRDREAMGHALGFAETGHLCLATLHANNTNQAIDRIVNFFPEERHKQLYMDLAMNLTAILSQRLLPTKVGKGRAAAVEIMINTPYMRDLIRKPDVPGIKELIKDSRNLGMQTFDQALFDLHEAEAIAYEEAERNADSPNDLRLNVKLNSKIGKTVDFQANTYGLQIMEDSKKR